MTSDRVAVIGSGGTISYRARDPLDLYDYADGGTIQGADELIGSLPVPPPGLDLVPIRFRALSSTRMGPGEWLELNDLVHRVAAAHPALAGIVVTHGTATLEETAYFLSLVVKLEIPVVLVGAQRPSGGISSDSGLNLLNACRVAAAPAARGLGVLVVLNDEIQAAREVTKTSTWRVQTFRTPDLGILGYADPDGRIAIYRSPSRRHTTATPFDVRGVRQLPRVDIAYSYAGSDGAAIDAFVRAGARAVVVASLAPGRLTPDEARAATDAVRSGVLVILSTRAGSGRVIPLRSLREAGLIAADNLNPQKARVLAMLALATTTTASEIQALFEEC